MHEHLFSEHQVVFLVLLSTSEALKPSQIFLLSFARVYYQLFGQRSLWQHTWRASSATGATLLRAGTRDLGGRNDMTWSDREAGSQGLGKSPRLCFCFSSCTTKEVSEFLLDGFQKLLQEKKNINPADVHLRLIITGIIMIYSHHKSWGKKRGLRFARFAGWQKQNTALIALLCCV